MDLFQTTGDPLPNLLPYDGLVEYHGTIMNRPDADRYLELLLTEIEWRHDEAVIFGKRILTKRKVAWYADEAFSYTYSNTTKTAIEWSPLLLDLKLLVEEVSGETFNSCLLNLYRSGDEGMAWHSDSERDLLKDGTIGSLSLGAERKFSFKHKKTKMMVSQPLEPGSLLVMKGTTQTHWLHSIPKTKTVTIPRVNLTFRQIRRS